MSVYVFSKVWRISKQKGNPFLLLLALADIADETGRAGASIEFLARKLRISERQVYRLISRLAADGELKVQKGGGRGKTNIYRVSTK